MMHGSQAFPQVTAESDASGEMTGRLSEACTVLSWPERCTGSVGRRRCRSLALGSCSPPVPESGELS